MKTLEEIIKQKCKFLGNRYLMSYIILLCQLTLLMTLLYF